MDHRLTHLLDGGFKLRHLQLISAIAANGTISGAAQDLYVTQPVVTRALREAEEILGVRLFDRSPRGVTPTKYGVLILEHAEVILTSIERLADNITHLESHRMRPIRVGTNMSGSYALLPRTLISVKTEHPELKVSVIEGTEEDLAQMLTHHQVDVLIGRIANQNLEGMVQARLYDEPIVIMGRTGHPVFQMPTPTPADLVSFPWVVPPPSAVGSRLGPSFGEPGEWVPTNIIECTSILTIRSILHATDSLAPLPMLVGSTDPELRMLPIELDAVPRRLGVTYPASPEPNDSTQVFIHHLRRVAQQIDAELREPPTDSS